MIRSLSKSSLLPMALLASASTVFAQLPTRTVGFDVPFSRNESNMRGSGPGGISESRPLSLNFPRFDPSLGTLQGITIYGSASDTPEAEVDVNFSFGITLDLHFDVFRELELGLPSNPSAQTLFFERAHVLGGFLHLVMATQQMQFAPVFLPSSMFPAFTGSGTHSVTLQQGFLIRVEGSSRIDDWEWEDRLNGSFHVDYEYVPAPRVESYGTGCYAADGLVPEIYAEGMPSIGNAAFAVSSRNGREGFVAALQLAGAAGSLPLNTRCTLLVGVPYLTLPGVLVDNQRIARTPTPVPSDPALLEAQLFLQYTILDTGGAFLGLACFSNGLAIRIGA